MAAPISGTWGSWLSGLSCPIPGKSMLLSAIGKREVPIPEHIDIYHLTREMPPSDKTPLQCVMEVDTERAMLEREAERLAHEDGRAPHPGLGCSGHLQG